MFRKRWISLLICIIYIITFTTSLIGCTTQDNKTTNEGDGKDMEVTEEVNSVDQEDIHKDKEIVKKNRNNEVKKTQQSDIGNKEQDKKDEINTNRVTFKEEKTRTVIEVPYEKLDIEAKVKPYSVKNDLTNIENLNQFGDFSEKQRELLSKNGFVVMPTKEEQLFYIYENNEYLKVPSFITTDSVLQVYHIFYDYSLRLLEQEKLMGFLETLTDSMLKKSIILYNEAENEKVKEALLKNMAYFTVAEMALERELRKDIPEQALALATKEYALIKSEAGFRQSYIFPYDLDYSQYKPRGHYTRNEDFKKYFKAMMWYGQVPFPLHVAHEGMEKRSIEQSLQAMLITYCVFMEGDGESDLKLWENIYDPTNFYVGSADDLNIYHYKDLLVKAYGDNPDIDTFTDKDKLDIFYEEAKKLPEPKIKPKYTGVKVPVGKQFRFMGQRYVPDAEIVQNLVEPLIRPVPSGLDVMGVLGSEKAYDIQININKEAEKWPEYPEKFKKMEKQFDKLDEEKWKSNMYYGWLWTLKGLLKEYDEGYPSFMTNAAWEEKSLSTALGSWSELKHDTILYGKQSGAECGGGLEPPKVKGYVEPNVEVYSKLLWLTKYSRENLKSREILTGKLESKLQQFEDLLQFLINCSMKELENEELTEDEYEQLLTYGGLLEHLTSSFAGDGMRWFEITSEADKNMAVIADIHTIAANEFSDGGYLEVGVGPAYEMYVVVPINNKLYLTRGAVFSYFEFQSEKRLTDEEWQKLLKEDKYPPQLKWMDDFIDGDKREIPMPKEPYSSGC